MVDGMTKHRVDLHCSNGHQVTIRYEGADVGIVATPPATLYETPPIAPVSAGVVTTWGIEQKCTECGETVKHSVPASSF